MFRHVTSSCMFVREFKQISIEKAKMLLTNHWTTLPFFMFIYRAFLALSVVLERFQQMPRQLFSLKKGFSRPMWGNPTQFWILDSTPGIPDSRYWIPDSFSAELGFQIPIVREIRNPWAVFRISTRKIYWIPESGFYYMARILSCLYLNVSGAGIIIERITARHLAKPVWFYSVTNSLKCLFWVIEQRKNSKV